MHRSLCGTEGRLRIPDAGVDGSSASDQETARGVRRIVAGVVRDLGLHSYLAKGTHAVHRVIQRSDVFVLVGR